MTIKEKILSAVKENNIRFIDLWFTDILGIIKSVTVPASKLESVIVHGSHFDGSSIDGFARVAESDMELHPDLNTFRILPWTSDKYPTARLICNVYTSQGDPFIGDPRTALINVLDEANQMGYQFKTGMEMEFFILKDKTTTFDNASYFDMPPERTHHIWRELLLVMEELGVKLHSIHSEIAQGQHEFEFAYNDALKSADAILTAKVAIKTISEQNNLLATFMPRPIANLPGSGMHTHQSLHDTESDQNLFSDPNHEYGLSQLAQHFLAGQLAHARAMTAILAPLVNSYKRLGKSFEAPSYVTWAHVNRSALIRIPSVQPGREDHTRLELRCPDPSCNPYLASAVILKAGLDGIRNKMPLNDAFEETMFNQKQSRLRKAELLPTTLGEALEALQEDDVILDALGPYIADRFIQAKQQEFDEYNRHVSQWEVDRYFDKY
jgi:glutamine synthetase